MVQELDKILKNAAIDKKDRREPREDDPFRHERPHVLDQKCKEWYDRVYLCSQDVTTFKCEKFNYLKMADRNSIIGYNYKHFTTMIPMCRFTPEFMDRFFLKRKLFGMFRCELK